MPEKIHPAHAQRMMKERGYTLQKIGDELGVTRQCVQRIFSGSTSQRVQDFIDAIVGPVAWPEHSRRGRTAIRPLAIRFIAVGLTLQCVADAVGTSRTQIMYAGQAVEIHEKKLAHYQDLVDRIEEIIRQAEEKRDAASA